MRHIASMVEGKPVSPCMCFQHALREISGFHQIKIFKLLTCRYVAPARDVTFMIS